MLLIKETLKNYDYSQETVVSHYFKKIYDKKVKTALPRATAPTPSSGSFMRDARSSGAHRQAAVPSFAPQVKKQNWFQKHILCMNIDIRKGQ